MKIGIYTISDKRLVSRTVRTAITELHDAVDLLVIVGHRLHESFDFEDSLEHACVLDGTGSAGGRLGLLAIAARYVQARHSDDIDTLVVSGTHIIGPFVPLGDLLAETQASGRNVYAPLHYFPRFHHRPELHTELFAEMPERIVSTEFLIVRGDALADPALWTALTSGNTSTSALQIPRLDLDLHNSLAASGHLADLLAAPHGFETIRPWLYEADKVLSAGIPFMSVGTVHLPYVLQDLDALDLRTTLETLRRCYPAHFESVWAHILHTEKLRNIHAIADEFEIIDEVDRRPEADRSTRTPLAILIHAFYADMMPEFWRLIDRIQVPRHVYVSTATEQSRAEIETFLRGAGLPASEFEVRVVEQNRGRDMSSLFITFRDVVLSDRHEICLRLHSKRTPQVARQVGRSFKQHLFDNLVASRGYVNNLLDFMDDNPNVGLLMPPTVHIGFGTLGHSWFNNREGVEKLASLLDLDVELDDATPLAPYGTMFWFRSRALRKMFEHAWRWEDYNAEPRHVDGGLAHMQERLLGYVAQDAGYRVMSISNRRAAARNYVKLEYKLQLLASRLPYANIVFQDRYLLGGLHRIKVLIAAALTSVYQNHVIPRPALLGLVRPFAKLAARVFSIERPKF